MTLLPVALIRVLLVREDPLAQPDPLVPPAVPDTRDPQDPLERRVDR